jgi:transcriptional regulator with XRE-family HTH domain
MLQAEKMPTRLQQIRFWRGISQIRLALKTRIHFSTLSRIEHGYLKPTPEQRKRISKALNIDPDWLFPSSPKSKQKDSNQTDERNLAR